jgi:hypothetical protein
MNELELFTEALARTDPAERAAFLDQACAGNPDLRRQLDQLLAGHAQPDSPLDRPPVEPAGRRPWRQALTDRTRPHAPPETPRPIRNAPEPTRSER